MSNLTPSPYQHAIYHEIVNGDGNLIVEAVAGSGKTTTLVEATRLIPKGGLSIVLAFNKHTQEELARRLPYTTQSHTFHSWCYSALKRVSAKPPKIDAAKCRKILKDNSSTGDYFKYQEYSLKLASLAKSFGYDTAVCDLSLLELAQNFQLECDGDASEGRTLVAKVLEASLNDKEVIDFDDMIYHTLRDNVPFQLCDFVFVDEAQDLNGVQRELLSRMLKPSGRLIAVGDPHQAIYGFRGADANSLSEIQSRFSTKTLPLSVSYRCSQEVVKEAQRILDQSI